MAFDPYDSIRSALPAPSGTPDPMTPLRMLASFQQRQAQSPSPYPQAPAPSLQQQSTPPTGLASLQPPVVQPRPAQSYGLPSYEELSQVANRPAPALPEAPKTIGAWDTIKDIGSGVIEAARGLPATVASQIEGVSNPYTEVDWKDRAIEDNRARQQANIQALRDSGEYDRPMGLGMPFTRGQWAETTQSFPHTLATVGPSVAGSMVGRALGAVAGGAISGVPSGGTAAPVGAVVGGNVGSVLGGMGGAYFTAGGAAANQFIRSSLEKYRDDFTAKNGRAPSAGEMDAYYKDTVEPQASRVYHGEAAPESAGTVAEIGLAKSAIGDVLHSGGSVPARLVKAAAKVALSAFGIEPATEAITQQIQQPAYAATGLTDEAPRSLSSPEDWAKSAGEVYKQAAATSLFFSALGIPAGTMYGKYQQHREGNAQVNAAEQATADLRANLSFARDTDIAKALAGYDQIEAAGKLPKAAAKRLDAARQQLAGELALRATPEALAEPIDTARGKAGYLGFASRPNELSDDQLIEAAQRTLPQDAAPDLQNAQAAYGKEIQRRKDLTLAASHFDSNPEAVSGVASTLARIANGKPMAKGAHGSTDFNLASLSDDMLTRYRLASEVLLRDHSDTLKDRAQSVERAFTLMNQEAERRQNGERRDPQAIREADVAEKVASTASLGTSKKAIKRLVDGMPPDAVERMITGLESRVALEPELSSSIQALREQANQSRNQAFNPEGTQGIQSALARWNTPRPQPEQQQAASEPSPVGSENAPSGQEEQNASPPQTEAQPSVGVPAGPEGAGQSVPTESAQPEVSPQILGQVGGRTDNPVTESLQQPTAAQEGWQQFAPETGTLGIPRAEMPQIKAEHRGAMVNFMNARGVSHQAETGVSPDTLQPTQAEFSPEKVQKAADFKGGDRSILVSSDNRVLDGHHQWLAAKQAGKPINVIRLNAPVSDLIPLAKEFPSSTTEAANPQSAKPASPINKQSRYSVDTEKDSLLTAVAKLGGLDRVEAKRQGIDPADFKKMPVFGKPAFRKNGGKSFDAIAEVLSELGYPVTDNAGNYSPNVLLERVWQELNGNPYYTPRGFERIAQLDAEEQARIEQEWGIDAFDLESVGFDTLDGQDQVTAEWVAEAYRDLGEDSADALIERISVKHESSTPEQFNAALREAIDRERQKKSDSNRAEAVQDTPVAPESAAGRQSESVLAAEEVASAKPAQEQKANERPRQSSKADSVPGNAEEAQSDSPNSAPAKPADRNAGKAAPTWNNASQAERETLLKATGASDDFSQRKGKEWADWGGIPEGAVKGRLRDLIRNKDQANTAQEPSAVEPKQEADASDGGQVVLAARVKDYLLASDNGRLSPQRFWAMANLAFGGTQASGTYSSKDAYDAMELGLNLAVIASGENGTSAKAMRSAVQKFEEMQNRLPTQTKRDDEQQRMQQFSTPHPHAHVAAWVAGVNDSDAVLEPTAGTGNIVSHAKLFGAKTVYANELSERRAKLLQEIPGVRTFTENAGHLNAVLPKDVKPTVVVMNPPFSADTNMPGKKALMVGADHITQAIQRLQDGGRLVAIVGRGMSMNAPRFREWWKDMARQYNVRANVAISGKEYTKFGTSFDNRILVIDKTGATPEISAVVGGEVAKVQELIPLLEGVRNERALQQNPIGETSQESTQSAQRDAEQGTAVPVAANAESAQRQEPMPSVSTKESGPTGSAGRAGREPNARSAVDQRGAESERGNVQPASEQPTDTRADRGNNGEASVQPVESRRAAEEKHKLEIDTGAMDPTDTDGFGDSVFETYRPSVTIKGAKTHPTPLTESAAMGSVSFPKLHYTPNIKEDIVTEGNLSSAQLETIAYAGQAHSKVLPNGERRGMFVGDGTGVGKGAQIAGIILDNWNNGRKKAVWVSENARLFSDAQRDAEWVGLGKGNVFLQGKEKGDIARGDGVIFTTYPTLRSQEKGTKDAPGERRIDQLIKWLGPDFDGVIAFDEAHNMANATETKGSRGTAKPSAAAMTGIELQKMLPKARVLYVSATGATEVRNLAYASRLGLWGEGTAFPGRADFINGINAGGLAAMEVVAKDMKAMGVYTARSLSYDGVEVEPLVHALTEEQATMYDGLARAWQRVLAGVETAMASSNSNEDAAARSAALSAFWGTHQRFFNGVLTALSAPAIIRDMQKQLDAGNSVVGQLVSTNEAAMDRKLAQAAETGQELDELDFSPRDALMQYLHNSFPTALFEKYTDDDGNEQSRPVKDRAGNFVEDPNAVAIRDNMLEELATLPVPDSIIDQITNHFGPKNIAEITGRSKRVVRNESGSMQLEKRSPSQTAEEAKDFNKGNRRILIFSDAGGTGRSYHADLRIENQQKRVHYLIQPGWRADKAIQGLGRTHRTNQKQPPLFKTVTTNIKSQARFVSSIARRMSQMGALTKGQRDAAAGSSMFDDDMNLEDQYSTGAVSSLFMDIAAGKVAGITPSIIEKQMGIALIDARSGNIVVTKIPSVQKFLNRILSLEISMMDRIFSEFDIRRKRAIEYAKQVGAYDGGMETLRAKEVRKEEDKVAATHESGADTRYVKLVATHDQKFLGFDGLDQQVKFVKNRKSGRLYALEPGRAITDPVTGEQIQRVRRVSPIGANYMTEKEAYNRDRYEPLPATMSEADKRAAWEKETASYPDTYEETIHMITGALLPVWDRIQNTGNDRVIRVQTKDRERLIGRVIDSSNIGSVLKALNVEREQAALSGDQAIKTVLEKGNTLLLANGWKIARRVVNGEQRIEVIIGAPSQTIKQLLEGMGAFSEIINWQSRLFLPTDKPAIIERVMKSQPVAEIIEPTRRYSRSGGRPIPVGAMTREEARKSLASVLGDKQVAAMEREGRLVIHRDDPTKTGAAGYVDANGVIHLVPANMDQTALDVALHEGMHLARDDRFSEGDRSKMRIAHTAMRMLGIKNFIGSPGFSDLAQQVQRMAAEGNATAIEALNKAKTEWRSDPTVDVAEEAVAYLAQYADQRLPLVRRVLAAIRAALYRMGIRVNLTPSDVRALALSALKSQARKAIRPAVSRQRFSTPSSDTEEQERLWKEFQAVRAQFQERQASESAFSRWFGRGTEGVTARDGAPITLYHGTNNPEFNSWDGARAGAASGHPTAGLGFFMTADKRSAARYGSRLLELNARINKPYYLTDNDLVAIDDVKKAARMRSKLMHQGYDGAVVSAPGAAPYVIAFESKQVKYTSNENPTESADFRYSRSGRRRSMDSPRIAAQVLDDIGGLRNDLKPTEKTRSLADFGNLRQMLGDLKTDSRPQWLGLLTQDMLVQLASEQLPAAQVKKFDDASEAMDAYESRMIQDDAFPIAERWQAVMRQDRQQADAVSRALYLSTWLGVDPRKAVPKGKQAEWVRAKAAYDALQPKARTLYSDVLGFYEKQTERLFGELDARIARLTLNGKDKQAAQDRLRQEFERMKSDGPYAPLMRFGDLTVYAEPRHPGEKPVFAAFESAVEQRSFVDYLKREGYAPKVGVKMGEIEKRNLPTGDFVGKMAGIIDKTSSGQEADVLKDALHQLFLRSLPEQAIRKHFIHRKFVPGYSADALRTFAMFSRRSAKQIARLAHADEMSDSLNAMAKAVRDGSVENPVAAGHLVNELDKSYQWTMNPTTATWASRLTHLGFMWHLGASPAHLLLNLSQQAQVTLPWLAGELHGKKGFAAVAGALAKANKDFVGTNPFVRPDKVGARGKAARAKIEAEYSGDLGRALKSLEEAGKVDKTQTYSISGLSEEDNFLWTKPWTRMATKAAGWFFHTAEVINREATAIAAYRLGRDSGMHHDQAYDFARRSINESHWDYSPSNRARFMRSNVAKVITLFKQYSLNITWQLGRNAYLAARGATPEAKAKARTKLLGMLGMTFVMAGAVGLPFYGEVMWLMTQLLNATRDDDEPEWDADTEFRQLLDQALSPTGEQAVRRGLINAFMGIDLSSRIKLDDLWWRSDVYDRTGRQAASAALEQILGPVAGLAVTGYAATADAFDALVSGTNAKGATWRAAESALPKVFKDISRGFRYLSEGEISRAGARVLDPGELGYGASAGQLLGFTPAALAEKRAENRAMMDLQSHIKNRRRALMDTYAMAYTQNDSEVMQATLEDMRAFNKRYPTVAITGQSVRQSLKARARRRAEMEQTGGVPLDKRLAGMLLEGGA